MPDKTIVIETTKIQARNNSKPGSSKFIGFLLLIGNFANFKWLITIVLIKISIILDKKKDCKNWAYENLGQQRQQA